MAKSREIIELNEKFDSMVELVNTMVEKQSQTIEKPKSKLATHVENVIENAINSPASTLSGVGIAVCYVGPSLFPQHTEVFENLRVACETMVGVSAGSTVLKRAGAKTTKTNTPKVEEYG